MLTTESILHTFKTECDWKCMEAPGSDAVMALFASKKPKRSQAIIARVVKDTFHVRYYRHDPDNPVSVLPVPKKRRNAVAQGIVMLNYNLLLGGFQMDYKDGEFSYALCAPLIDGALPSATVARCAETCRRTYLIHCEAFESIIDGTPAPEAIRDAKRGPGELLEMLKRLQRGLES